MLDPTLHVVLVKAGARRAYTISTSTKFDGWPYLIDRCDRQQVGIAISPERALALKDEFEAEIEKLKMDGWIALDSTMWGR